MITFLLLVSGIANADPTLAVESCPARQHMATSTCEVSGLRDREGPPIDSQPAAADLEFSTALRFCDTACAACQYGVGWACRVCNSRLCSR